MVDGVSVTGILRQIDRIPIQILEDSPPSQPMTRARLRPTLRKYPYVHWVFTFSWQIVQTWHQSCILCRHIQTYHYMGGYMEALTTRGEGARLNVSVHYTLKNTRSRLAGVGRAGQYLSLIHI